ncbi:MAG: GGDEF domain-containing protein [Nitriliruptoraceae bacterium]
MARPTLSSRTLRALTHLNDTLRDPSSRVVVLGGGLVVSLAAHLFFDAQFAWASAPIILLAGISGGPRRALAVAGVAALGHGAVDVVPDGDFAAIPGTLVRGVVMFGIGLIGAAGALVERQREEAMERAISEDPVTGLLNVRAFYEALQRLRDEDRPFAIVLADIRGMRALNDRYGHPTGTEAMRALAHVLRRAAGPDVLASRLGSDEVAVALVNADRQRCRAVVERIIDRLHNEQVALPDGEQFEVHAAYGVARFPEDGDDEVAVLRAADRAKERAKAAGMDRVGTAEGDVL